MGNENIEKWSTLKEVQAYLGVGRETILQWIAKRNMPAYKVGKLWKFKLSEVDVGFVPAVPLTTKLMKRKIRPNESIFGDSTFGTIIMA